MSFEWFKNETEEYMIDWLWWSSDAGRGKRPGKESQIKDETQETAASTNVAAGSTTNQSSQCVPKEEDKALQSRVAV